MPMAAGTWRLKNVDLVVSLSHCVAKSVRVRRGVPHVCYCFTPMRYAWQGATPTSELVRPARAAGRWPARCSIGSATGTGDGRAG